MEVFKKNRHSVYSLKYYLVVITKYRHKCINQNILNNLNEIFKNIIGNQYFGVEVIVF